VANSSASTGVAWSGPSVAAGKNLVINGGMDFWQRGTSSTANSTTNTGITADRWQAYYTGTMTTSRQATSDTTNLPNIQYCARVQRNSGQTSTGAVNFSQTIETSESIRFAGKTVTYSFYARAGANFSAASNVLQITLFYGTGTDQNVYAFTGLTSAGSATPSITTTWTRYSITATVPATATELSTFLSYVPTGTAGTNDYFEVTGVQLELGSVATAFSRAGGTLQGELAACQRYLPAIYFGQDSFGNSTSTTNSQAPIFFKVTARVAPTGVTVSNLSDWKLYNKGGGSSGTPTAIALGGAGVNNATLAITTNAGSPTIASGEIAELYCSQPAGYILFTGCEL